MAHKKRSVGILLAVMLCVFQHHACAVETPTWEVRRAVPPTLPEANLDRGNIPGFDVTFSEKASDFEIGGDSDKKFLGFMLVGKPVAIPASADSLTLALDYQSFCGSENRNSAISMVVLPLAEWQRLGVEKTDRAKWDKAAALKTQIILGGDGTGADVEVWTPWASGNILADAKGQALKGQTVVVALLVSCWQGSAEEWAKFRNVALDLDGASAKIVPSPAVEKTVKPEPAAAVEKAKSASEKVSVAITDGVAAPLFAKASIAPLNEESFMVTIPKGRGRAELSFKCRVDFSKWAGHNQGVTVRVNGREVSMQNILGRPASFKTADGKTAQTAKGNAFLCYFAPDVDAVPSDCPYKPVDSGIDVLAYRMDIGSYLVEGENQITFRNVLPETPKYELALSKAEIIYQASAGDKKTADYGKLEVADKNGLLLNYNGKPLIVANELVGLADLGQVPGCDVREKNGVKIWNIFRENDEKLKFRREMAIHPNGSAELTFKSWCASYVEGRRGYTFSIPYSALKGCKFTARVGRTYGTKEISGVLDDKFADYIGGTDGKDRLVRYLAFEGENVHLVFDFNAYGVTQMYSDYPYTGEPLSFATVRKDGDFLVFTLTSMKQGSSGGVYAAKTIIYPGVYEYDARHPYQNWTYRGGPEPLSFFSFGTPDAKIIPRVEPEGDGPAARVGPVPPPKPPIGTRADLNLYAAWRTAGWEKEAGLKLTDKKSLNVFANAAYSPDGSPATFLLDAKPGIYVITLKLGHPDSDIGPFDILINGKPSVSGISVAKGETETVLIPHYVRAPEKQVRIQFQGKKQWAVNAIAVQVLLYQNEDFFWDRGLWLADGLFEPDFSVPGVPRKKKTFTFEPKVVSRTAFQKSPYTYISKEKEILLPPNVPETAWRASMKMGLWADESHSATGFEFNSPELAERRVLELKAAGYNTINCASLFWNQGFTERWDEAIAMTRLVCDAAHKHGMKVVYHMDGPIPLYHNTGLANMLSHLDWMQTDVQYGLPTFIHMNPNYPGFCNDFIERLVRMAKEANLDGYMIDEYTYSSIKYSGDPATRKVFEAETGLRLPVDTSSSVWYNDDDVLWRQWIRWRQKNVGDWMLTLRKELNKFNPNFTLFTYITHYGFTEPWANKEFGLTIQEMGRSCDMVGTEIQSRNVFDAHRSVLALRKAKAAVGDYLGSSVYGLVYPAGDPSIAYFGWALNYMNRQLTWISFIPGENMKRYLDWPDQMSSSASKSMGEAAILISASSRDFGKYMASFPDAHGTSELLSDAHIQHDFIVEDDLTSAKLAGYKALFLCSTPCLSKTQVEVIRNFVRNGGILFATGHTSLQDENGKTLEHLQLADLFGADVESSTTVSGLTFRNKSTAEKTAYPLSLIKVKPIAGGTGVVVGEMEDASGTSAGPGLIENTFGKGVCVYSPCQIGMVNWEKEYTVGDKWVYEKNVAWEKLLMDEVEKYLSPKLSFQATEVPARVLVGVTADKKTPHAELRVHLLNATGAAKFKKGDVVPAKKAADSFPMLDKDITFTINQPGVVSAVAVSPDYQGERSVEIENKGNGVYQFRVHKEDCKTFADVIIKLK
ncbi:MAG: beta-galactosidase trimerization domain-containing protein [Verrucomicrobia bacterium]|nr:beta-galactosidase trimerization domain-containing protein [Verrucomicrobiota bacterium]